MCYDKDHDLSNRIAWLVADHYSANFDWGNERMEARGKDTGAEATKLVRRAGAQLYSRLTRAVIGKLACYGVAFVVDGLRGQYIPCPRNTIFSSGMVEWCW